ncbi:hypothetical protein NGRA_2951 [Nosema granulosis]|uniref:Uncharacterized protein n=1 Tax=Nosema granulosis TaxID=83296 RepID=A0A9P6KXP2_9MICR|nr:hypothetical protein NGRA_2951 [Nosema granulosis]
MYFYIITVVLACLGLYRKVINPEFGNTQIEKVKQFAQNTIYDIATKGSAPSTPKTLSSELSKVIMQINNEKFRELYPHEQKEIDKRVEAERKADLEKKIQDLSPEQVARARNMI